MRAGLFHHGDGAIARQRVAHAAFVIVVAAGESLERARVALRDDAAIAAGLGAHGARADIDGRLVIRRTARIDARRTRLLAECRHLELRQPARGARLVNDFHLAVRHGILHIALRPTRAADELAAGPPVDAELQALAALRARAHVRVRGDRLRKRGRDLLLRGKQGLELTSEQIARDHDDIVLGALARRDVAHVVFELCSHLRMRDARRVGVERVDDGHAELRGLDGVVLDVVHLVQALNDRVARGLRAEAELLHLLDEAALAVALRRLGLLLRACGAVERDQRALLERGELVVLLQAVGIDRPIPGLHGHVAVRDERFARAFRLAGHLELHRGALDDRGLRERGQEPPRDQVVELVIRRGQVVGRGLRRRIDRRMVRLLLVAARGLELSRREQLVAVLGIRRIAREHADDLGQIERRGIHRVVDARIRDVAGHVQTLGDAHRARRADALGSGGGHEARRVERRGRPHRAPLLLDGGHERGLGTLDGIHDRLRCRLGFELLGGMRGLESILALAERALDDPIVLGHERQTLLLARYDER